MVVLDGDCLLCNRTARWVIRHDPLEKFQFVTGFSALGEQLLKKVGCDADADRSIILVVGEKVYTKSEAVLRVCKELSGGYPMLYILILVPAFLRNIFYDFIARNRFRWFGKTTENCELIKGYEGRLLSHID